MKTETHLVYGLVDPNSNEVFYVGCTTKPLDVRLNMHYWSLNEANSGTSRLVSTRHTYLNNLLPKTASIVLLDSTDSDNWEDLEKEYIAKYKLLNPNLTNGTIGGTGGDTYSGLTAENRRRKTELVKLALTGRPKPEGFAENLSTSRTGAGNPRAGFTKYGKIVRLNAANEVIRIYDAGYEFTEGFGKYYYGNLMRVMCNLPYLAKYHFVNKHGFWNFEHNLEFNPMVRFFND